MIYYIQVVSEKAFCHWQISMISFQNFLATFWLITNIFKQLEAWDVSQA